MGFAIRIIPFRPLQRGIRVRFISLRPLQRGKGSFARLDGKKIK